MTTPAAFGFSDPAAVPMTAEPVDAPLTAPAAPPALVVPVEQVARRLGLDPATLTEIQVQRITDAVTDATAVVEGELNRPLVPVEVTMRGAQPYLLTAGGLLDRTSWPAVTTIADEVEITSATANADGSFDLALRIGLDGSKHAAIQGFIRAHAVEALRLDPGSGMGQLAVSSVSAEGQSISYEKRSTTDGAAGALPSLRSLRHWKRMSVYQGPSRKGPPWPYGFYRR